MIRMFLFPSYGKFLILHPEEILFMKKSQSFLFLISSLSRITRSKAHWAFAVFLISSCGIPSEKKSQEEKKTVFRYNEASGIETLDPAYARHTEDIWVMNQLYNGLVQMDSNLKVQPCIAKRWEISGNGKVYTFFLRDDVFFHDHPQFKDGKGRKVTSADFIYSFFRVIDPNIASYGFSLFNNYLDKSEKNNYKGFDAPNDTVLKIFLNEPNHTFINILTMQYFSVIPKEIVEYYGKDFRRNPVGTGPFRFKMWSEGVKLILVKNDNYFETDGTTGTEIQKQEEKKLPYLDAVSISFVKDKQLSFLDFVRGNYDFMSGLDGSFKDLVFTQEGALNHKYVGKFNIEKRPYLKTDYLGILIDEKSEIVKKSPLKLKVIRQAINYGIDKEKLVKYLRNNIGMPASSGFVPRGLPSFDSTKVKGYKYNPEKARDLLYVAGFPEGKGLPAITLTTTVTFQTHCEFIQHELGTLGININIEVIDDATYREMVAQSKVSMFCKNWIADYPDAENFLGIFYSKNFSPAGANYTKFNNFKFDKLYERSLKEKNDSLRYDYYRQMDQLVIDEAPIVPLFYDEIIRFVQKDVHGLESNPMNLLILKRVKKSAMEAHP